MEKLFQPLKLSPLELRNRVVMAPMSLGFVTADETWPERCFPYFEERCRGETGLIITPFTNATRLATIPLVGSYHDRFLSSHRRLADLVHRYDTKVFLQIAATGGKGADAAPSAIESPNYPGRVPRELAVEEIRLIVQDFAQAAARAKKAGFDGVELHGGHTYLVGSFVSPHTNRRQDEYGGDFEGRMRFPVEIVRAIRQQVGDDYPIGYKFSMWEELQGGVEPELGIRIAERMAQEGVCYLHVSSTSATLGLASRYPSVSTMYTCRHALVPLARAVKQAVPDVAVIAAGGIDDPREAEEMIARGDCDLVALGRGLLAEPHWARKARVGQRIRPCIRCNVCYHRPRHTPMLCTVNPYLHSEAQQPLPPIDRPKKLMVVGGGPAGIVAALTAAARGHEVTLCEKADALGGQVIPGSRAPFKSDVARLLQYWREEIAESQVEVRLNTEVTPEIVRREKPDALVLAVGATPVLPCVPGIDGENVLSAAAALVEPTRLDRSEVIVLGGGEVGCECAVFLARRGNRVTLVEMLEELLPNTNIHSARVDLLRMVQGEPAIEALTGAQVTEIREGGAVVRGKDGRERFVKASWVVVAIGLKPLTHVAHQLAAECADVRIVGDCLQPGRIRDAVVQGDLAGRLI